MRSKDRWKYNIKVNLKAVEGECIVWIHVAQDRDLQRALVNTVTNLKVP
jgi:hypothetical protein